jgi:molybdopterin/thiamine biosynthesis adenylyltransferase
MLVLTIDNIPRIVSYMLNFEHGYTLYNDNLELNSESNIKKFPIVSLPNGSKIHYRPTCGIIFYNIKNFVNSTESVDFIDAQIYLYMMNIYETIKHYDSHLIKERITAITGACIVKKNKFVSGTHIIKSPNVFKFTKKNIKKFPARLIVYLPIHFNAYSRYNDDGTRNHGILPPQYSTRASFMWYIMPMQFECIKLSINSIISSIYLDYNKTSKYNDKDIIYNISHEDINYNIIDFKDGFMNEYFAFLIKKGITHSSIINISKTSKWRLISIFKCASIDNILQFNCFNYINKNKCIDCDKIVSDIGIAALCGESEIDDKPLATLYCVNCWPICDWDNYFIMCNESPIIEEIADSIYSIDYDAFIQLITPTKKLCEYFINIYNQQHYQNNKSLLYNIYPKKIYITYKSFNYALNNIDRVSTNLLLIIDDFLIT